MNHPPGWPDPDLLAARQIAHRLRCDCYDSPSMEFDPDGPCPRCQLIDLLDQLLPPGADR